MKERYTAKKLDDGRAMLNLACGTKMDWRWTNLDFSSYTYLAHHRKLAHMLRRLRILSPARYGRLLKVDPDIVYYDLRNGIPFADNTFDVVYHSHFLEHIDKDSAPLFLGECRRVLKPNGILRVVVPDLQILVERYTSSLSALEAGHETALENHLKSIHDIFDQFVREQSTGTLEQHPLVRLIERPLRGDAAKTGELHRWMYDRYSLKALLLKTGFKNIRARDAFTSQIQGWNQFYLDINRDSSVYKPDSLYMEGLK